MTDSAALVAGFDLDAARWYAGKAREETGRRVVDAWPVGPGSLIVFAVDYADGGSDLYLLPAIDDDGLREAGPGDGVYAALAGGDGEERALGMDQTNTSVIVGDRIIKVYRRLEPGAHPEVEILEALAALGFDGIPAVRGSAARTLPDGSHVDLAITQELVEGAPDGWESLIAPLEALIDGEGDVADLGPELARVGRTMGRLHAELAAAFGVQAASDAQRAGWRDGAREQLDEALRILPHPLASELHNDATRIRVELEGFSAGDAPLVTRVHGDLHIAQFLRTPTGVFAIDFEGEPTRTIDERRQPTSPMRDVACLVRSLDHVARSAQVRAGLGAPAMDEWIRFAQEVVLASYDDGLGDSPVRLDRKTLRLFCLEKELYEFVYAARILPEWLYAPQLGMQWLMRDDAAL
jgi:trehalose synthase-fused probable maltokinase